MNDTPDWVWVNAPDLRPGMEITADHDGLPAGWASISVAYIHRDGTVTAGGHRWATKFAEDDRVQALRESVQTVAWTGEHPANPDDLIDAIDELTADLELVQALLERPRDIVNAELRIGTVQAALRAALGHPPVVTEPEPGDFDLYPTPPKAD